MSMVGNKIVQDILEDIFVHRNVRVHRIKINCRDSQYSP
jgi:hypothetical protein